MKLSEMRELLAREEIQLTKSLGQNFLHDGNQLRRIIEAAELSKSDKVLEIGPGLGPLTELLVEHAGEVLAIEKDRRLIEVLRKRFELDEPKETSETERLRGASMCKGTPVLQVIHDDALEYLSREPHDWREWKLVANLPYSVASPMIVELAQGEKSPQLLVVTLQLEVAKRLVAHAGDDDYGVLSLLVQLDFEPRDTFKIPASCFFPQPDVDSACAIMERRPQPLLPPELRDSFRDLVKLAFSQRRKMMLKLLKQHWPEERLVSAFSQAGLSPQARAEAVDLGQFVMLTSILR
jgi:16S rRNA (adenine1518-N6/adenine1519-N6)-dimethyltransferase